MSKKKTAAEVYADRRRHLVRLMAMLEQELARLDERQRAKPQDWTIVGSLGEVHRQLLEMIAFLQGIEPGEVGR